MPLSVQQQLHMPPASIVHRFCTMLQAIGSLHEQVIFMPPVHFSTLKVQRGTIMKLVPVGTVPGVPIVGVPIPGTPRPGIPIPVRSIITVLDMAKSFQGPLAPAGPSRGEDLYSPSIGLQEPGL